MMLMNYLDFLQKVNDLFFKIIGENSITINLQVFINGRRHMLDLPDENELIDEYVQ